MRIQLSSAVMMIDSVSPGYKGAKKKRTDDARILADIMIVVAEMKSIRARETNREART